MQLLDQSVRTLSTVDSDRYHYNYAGLVKTEKDRLVSCAKLLTTGTEALGELESARCTQCIDRFRRQSAAAHQD